MLQKIAQLSGTQAEKAGIDKLHHVETLQPGLNLEQPVQIPEGLEDAGLPPDENVGFGLHMEAAVGNHRNLVAATAQLGGKIGMHS